MRDRLCPSSATPFQISRLDLRSLISLSTGVPPALDRVGSRCLGMSRNPYFMAKWSVEFCLVRINGMGRPLILLAGSHSLLVLGQGENNA